MEISRMTPMIYAMNLAEGGFADELKEHIEKHNLNPDHFKRFTIIAYKRGIERLIGLANYYNGLDNTRANSEYLKVIEKIERYKLELLSKDETKEIPIEEINKHRSQ